MSNPHPPLDAYLAAETSAGLTESIDAHLIGCDRCWREVQLTRAARLAVQRSAEPVPPAVRKRLHDRLAAEQRRSPAPSPSWARGRWQCHRPRARTGTAAVVAAVIGVLAGVGAGAVLWGSGPTHPAQTSPAVVQSTTTVPVPDNVIAAAIMCYRVQELPGAGVPTQPAPDLTHLGLHLMAGGSGALADHPTSAYAYAADTRTVFVFTSATPFSAADGFRFDTAQPVDGLTVVSTSAHPMLVVGTDAALVATVATDLS